MMSMLRSALALLTDPVALLLILLAAAGAAIWGWQAGGAAARAECQAEELRQDVANITAQRDLLQGRLQTLTRITAADAARASAAAQADATHQQAIHDTPPNPSACLDAAAARRLRNVR